MRIYRAIIEPGDEDMENPPSRGWTYRAADQDGYNGGFIATNGKRSVSAWGETEAIAIENLAAKIKE
jgi:hypothetical protein